MKAFLLIIGLLFSTTISAEPEMLTVAEYVDPWLEKPEPSNSQKSSSPKKKRRSLKITDEVYECWIEHIPKIRVKEAIVKVESACKYRYGKWK